jgi:TIR domain
LLGAESVNRHPPVEEATMSKPDEVFTVFISHKHEDHDLAMAVKTALDGLNPGHVDCFVSGVDITAGMDWRREIRTVLARSHLLILLFTTPSKNWDWCLYEAGLYTRFDKVGDAAVVCLFNPVDSSPSPLADLQGVPAERDKLRAFLELMCLRTWELTDQWRLGALAPKIRAADLDASAESIALAFLRAGSTSTYYPCHRVVLSFSERDDIATGIPTTARVTEGQSGTSSYTMSLFNLAGGTVTRTWGDLLAGVDGLDAPWRAELDEHFLLALNERLFPAATEVLNAGHLARGQQRSYTPVLYSLTRGPSVGPTADGEIPVDRRPRSATILLVPTST